MVTGTSVKGSKDALRLTRIYPDTLYSTAGKFQLGIFASFLQKKQQEFIPMMPNLTQMTPGVS